MRPIFFYFLRSLKSFREPCRQIKQGRRWRQRDFEYEEKIEFGGKWAFPQFKIRNVFSVSPVAYVRMRVFSRKRAKNLFSRCNLNVLLLFTAAKRKQKRGWRVRCCLWMTCILVIVAWKLQRAGLSPRWLLHMERGTKKPRFGLVFNERIVEPTQHFSTQPQLLTQLCPQIHL